MRVGKGSAVTSFFVGILFWALVAVVWNAEPAYATQPPFGCIGPATGVQGHHHAGEGTHVGIKGSVWFGHSSSDCFRDSILVAAPDTSFASQVVWGWFLGYKFDSSCAFISTGYATSPTLYVLWDTPLTSPQCSIKSAQNPDQFRNLTLQDVNQDTFWSAFLGDPPNFIASMDVDFKRAYVITQGSRANPSDSAWSHFVSLQTRLAGSLDYFDFYDLRCLSDSDSGYYFSKVSETEHFVLSGTGACFGA